MTNRLHLHGHLREAVAALPAMKQIIALGSLFGEAAKGWVEHRAMRLGASLALYTTLALAPLAIIAMAVAGYFFGEEAARGGVVAQMEQLVGHDGATVIETLILKASEPQKSGVATAISIGLMLFGASGVFAELKDALDIVFEVKQKPGAGLWTILKSYALGLAVVAGTGGVLLISLLLTALLAGFTGWLNDWYAVPVWGIHLLELLTSFLVVTIMFALIFKLLPDVMIRWKDIWVGAIFTAVLFMIGKVLIGLYIGFAGVGSVYGAASSLVVVLVWTYYSSLILFFGAELVRAYTIRYAPTHLAPTANAESVPESETARRA